MKSKFFTVGMLCLGVSSAFAQDLSKDTLRLDEVVITSQYVKPTEVGRLPVPLSQAPLSVSRMSAPMISDLSLNSLIDVARNVTGVRPNNSYGGFQSFYIRGFNTFVVVTDGIRDERKHRDTERSGIRHVRAFGTRRGHQPRTQATDICSASKCANEYRQLGALFDPGRCRRQHCPGRQFQDRLLHERR